MSGMLATVLGRQRLVALFVLVLAGIGALSWRTMPRQEDPDIAPRWANIVVAFPGADAEQVERLVVKPIEDELAEIDEIRFINASARQNYGTVFLRLKDAATGPIIERAWDEVEDALEKASREFPEGVGTPSFDRDLADTEAIVWSVTGPDDLLTLRDEVLRLRDALQATPDVSRVLITGDPGETVVVTLDPGVARRLGLDVGQLARQIEGRNGLLPAGSVHSGPRSLTLAAQTELLNLDDLRQLPIRLASGRSLPLSEIADVSRRPVEPANERMRFQGRPALAVGVVARDGIDLVKFGAQMRTRADELRADYPKLQLTELSFQPDKVEQRIAGLGRSLMISLLIVAGILFLTMGGRLGLVVSSVVPLVALTALAIYAVGGGILHQMSISALVIALGMLVDNAIVVAENIQRRMDNGQPARAAALKAVRELAFPLLTATGTTMAAFVPMLLAEGSVGEFTRAIPILIMLTLTASLVYALVVTPLLSRWLLRRGQVGKEHWSDRLAEGIGAFAVRFRYLVILGVALALGLMVSWAGQVEKQFFPDADRNQVMLDLRLPEGSHLEATDEAARELEAALRARPEVASVASFVGRSAPHFYYNIRQVSHTPNVAQMLLTTTGIQHNAALVDFARQWSERHQPGSEVSVAALAQGPSIDAPVEIRFSGDDAEALREVSYRATAMLRQIEGAVSVRNTLSLGSPKSKIRVDDAAATRFGIARAEVAAAIFQHTRGQLAGQMRQGIEPVDIIVRSNEGQTMPAGSLGAITIARPHGPPVPLAQLVHVEPVWQAASYNRRNRERIVYVRANLSPGVPSSKVFAAFDARLDELALPASVTLSYGGEREGSGDANTAMLVTLPLAMLMLVGFLMVEFNSFRRSAIVLSTIPLAAVGVVPGLVLGGQPFGFMSMLGVFALAGVVVNNAIVLIDVTERAREAGASIDEALAQAVRLRSRPIMLTTLTTVAGLLPLALSSTSLWPPLAWAMISGLSASTLLTLVFVPALYRLLIRPGRTSAPAETPAKRRSAPTPIDPTGHPHEAWVGAE